ncbi:MAG TPA: choice-of-anchor Q domain-containing protein [Pyrinomonadaceae bacterium]|nr:choice-of-anchor Q domain-containing protein [Pyrinomonadaceae bacterium]
MHPAADTPAFIFPQSLAAACDAGGVRQMTFAVRQRCFIVALLVLSCLTGLAAGLPAPARRVAGLSLPTVGNTIVVNSTADVIDINDGRCTLREAMVSANTNISPGSALAGECAAGSSSGSDVIDLTHISGTIRHNTILPEISSDMTINGPGVGLLTVSGNHVSQNFSIKAGATVSINNLKISDGYSFLPAGEGIYSDGPLTLTNCVVSDNYTENGTGGGIYSDSSLTIINSTISGNHAVHGGGIVSVGGLTLINSTVSNNSAQYNGAGLYLSAFRTVTIINSTVSGNSAGAAAGGIYTSAPTTITNSTVSGNSSDLHGGGVWVDQGIVAINNCTIFNNRSNHDNQGNEGGGGISRINSPYSGTATLKNTIVAGNFRGTGATRDDINGEIDPSSSFNLIGDGTNLTGITNGNAGNQVGSSTSPINPALFGLANYGGPTLTHLPMPTSPAINAGSNANLPADTADLNNNGNAVEPLPVDQRGVGFARVVSGRVDIGAVEADYMPYLIPELSGPAADQAAALESPLLLRDPFPVHRIETWWTTLGADQNTRVILFVANLTPNAGDNPSAVVVNLTDANNQSFDVPAEDVRVVPGYQFFQVTFRLPDNIAAGRCSVRIKANGLSGNTGTFRIMP